MGPSCRAAARPPRLAAPVYRRPFGLEYNQTASLNVDFADPNSPYAVLSTAMQGSAGTPAQVITAAQNFLADANGKSEDAYFLNLNTDPETAVDANNGQGIICTDLLNFTNSAVTTASVSNVSTAIHDSGGGPVTGALGE